MNMLKKINRKWNSTLASFYNWDLELRKALMTAAAKKMQQSKNEMAIAFADGMMIGMVDGQKISRAHIQFYKKYEDCLLPSLWATRDTLAVLPESIRERRSEIEILEAAVAR